MDLQPVITAHQTRAASVTRTVLIASAPHMVKGTIARIVDLNVPTVILLTQESTPDNPMLSRDAECRFVAAAHQLHASGRKFYTMLHDGWNLPALLWNKG